MPLVDGAHHITFLTEDMDRLLAFYVRVFDAEVTLDMTEDGLRHAPGAHVQPRPSGPFALLAPAEEAFRELRRRIEAEGAADGEVRDMGSLWIMGYFDPDGAALEVILERPGFADSDVLERSEWTTVTLE